MATRDHSVFSDDQLENLRKTYLHQYNGNEARKLVAQGEAMLASQKHTNLIEYGQRLKADLEDVVETIKKRRTE